MWRPITATIATLAFSTIAMAQQDSTSMQGSNASGMSNSMSGDSVKGSGHHRRHHRSGGGMGSQGVAGVSTSGVEIMALQQELRDRGCSPGTITGHMNAQTRHAMACARNKGLTGDTPKAMLQSMNIGFNGSDASETVAFIHTGTPPSGDMGGGGSATPSPSGLGGSIGTPPTPSGTSNSPATPVPPTPPPTPSNPSGQTTPPTP